MNDLNVSILAQIGFRCNARPKQGVLVIWYLPWRTALAEHRYQSVTTDSLDAELAVMTELMAATFNLDKAKEFSAMDGEGLGSGASIVVLGVGPMGLVHLLKVRVMAAGDIIAFDRWDFRLAMAKSFGADVALECTGYPEAVTQGVQMVRCGGMYIVAGVFADVGSITLSSHHIAARQVCVVGMCPPSRGYPASMKLLEKFKDINPLRSFITLRSRVEDVAAAMAQVQELNACMNVVIAP